MLISDIVHVERRYQRSINIEQDFENASALEGYIFPESAKSALLSMAEQIAHSGQASFTWTGPYGSGKSSLALAFASLLTGTKSQRKKAADLLDVAWSSKLWSLLNVGKKPWTFIPIVGENEPIYSIVGKALKSAALIGKNTRLNASSVLKALEVAIPAMEAPTLLFIDEMGKVLEHAVREDGDIYFFQGLAELANRSGGKFVVIGVLHQAFQEYASSLSRRSKEEWAKIQGRYVDIAVDIRADEQITLLSQAINCQEAVPTKHGELAAKIAKQVGKVKKGFGKSMASTLENSWPLHPVIACLLGPMSRKGSGQNYRSVFSFLNSAETSGFQDFINHNSKDTLFGLTDLWNYILLNQKGAILASSDGHRWAIAIEAVERAQSLGLTDLATHCLQAITLLDWLKDGSGLAPTKDNISLCFNVPETQMTRALDDLENASLITFKRYNGSYGLFEGSDFDIEAAINDAKSELGNATIRNISDHVDLPTVIAKRHYHDTGTLRWANFTLTPINNIQEVILDYQTSGTGIALGIIYFRSDNENDADVKDHLKTARKEAGNKFEILTAEINLGQELHSLFEDIDVLGHILREQKEIRGDRIARREIRERIAHTTDVAKNRFFMSLDNLEFVDSKSEIYRYLWQDIGRLIDKIAKKRFYKAPNINNELLNRQKPSPQANLALKKLLYALLSHEGDQTLGFTAYPAERGLFEALLVSTGLYRQSEDDRWSLSPPDKKSQRLKVLWQDTDKFLKKRKSAVTNLQSLYDFWMAPPFGLTLGVCPLFATLYLKTNWSDLAFYRQGLFKPELSEVDIDVLLKSPSLIDVRRMEVSEEVKELLSEMTNLALLYKGRDDLIYGETIDVAKALIGAFDKLPPFAIRTQQISKNARNVRNLFRSAHDPNKFLLEDIPALKRFAEGEADLTEAQKIASNLKSGLDELFEAFPVVISRLQQFLLTELEVPNASSGALKELSERAKNVKGVSEDHVIEAFITRLESYDGSEQQTESLISLAAGKPSQNWIDNDVRKAEIKLSEFSRTFKHLETFAHIKGRKNKRASMAMVVDLNTKDGPVEVQFNVLDTRSELVDAKATQIIQSLKNELSNDRDVILSILAKASEKLIDEDDEIPRKKTAL